MGTHVCPYILHIVFISHILQHLLSLLSDVNLLFTLHLPLPNLTSCHSHLYYTQHHFTLHYPHAPPTLSLYAKPYYTTTSLPYITSHVTMRYSTASSHTTHSLPLFKPLHILRNPHCTITHAKFYYHYTMHTAPHSAILFCRTKKVIYSKTEAVESQIG